MQSHQQAPGTTTGTTHAAAIGCGLELSTACQAISPRGATSRLGQQPPRKRADQALHYESVFSASSKEKLGKREIVKWGVLHFMILVWPLKNEIIKWGMF